MVLKIYKLLSILRLLKPAPGIDSGLCGRNHLPASVITTINTPWDTGELGEWKGREREGEREKKKTLSALSLVQLGSVIINCARGQVIISAHRNRLNRPRRNGVGYDGLLGFKFIPSAAGDTLPSIFGLGWVPLPLANSLCPGYLLSHAQGGKWSSEKKEAVRSR